MKLAKALLAPVLSAAVLAALPPAAPACEFLERLFGCFCPSTPAPSTTYALYPVAPAPVCATPACATPACATSACAPQTCGYAPTVSYQTYYTPVQATVYQPVTSVNPCTGCPTTTYRPFTVLMQQPQVVPYASCAPACPPSYPSCPAPCSTGGCDTCPSGVEPSTYTEPAPSSCPSCVSGPTSTVAPPAPTSPYAPPVTAPPATVPPAVTAPPTPPCYTNPNVRPSLDSSTAPRTYEPAPGTGSTLRNLPVPPSGSNGPALQTVPPATRTAPGVNGAAIPNADVRPNSLPLPVLPNPNDRQAMRSLRTVTTGYEPLLQIGTQPVQDEMAWHESSR